MPTIVLGGTQRMNKPSERRWHKDVFRISNSQGISCAFQRSFVKLRQILVGSHVMSNFNDRVLPKMMVEIVNRIRSENNESTIFVARSLQKLLQQAREWRRKNVHIIKGQFLQRSSK